MTTEHKNRGGRPRGIVRCNCVRHGAYTGTERLSDVLAFLKKHSPGLAARAEKLIQQYLRALGWTVDHERYREVVELVVLSNARDALFMKVIDADFTRLVRDPVTKNVIKERPAEQLRRLEELDIEVSARLEKLGLLSKNK